MAQVDIRHSEDGLIVRHFTDDTGHISKPDQRTGPLAAVACDDFIAPALAGTHQGGLVHTAGADRLHQPLHSRIVPHTKGMILERVEAGEVQIDNFLFHGAGRITGLGRFRWRGRVLFLGGGRGSALTRGSPLALAGDLGGPGRGLGSAALGRILFPSLRRGPVSLGQAATAGLFRFFLGPLPFLLGALGNGARSTLLWGNLPGAGDSGPVLPASARMSDRSITLPKGAGLPSIPGITACSVCSGAGGPSGASGVVLVLVSSAMLANTYLS